MTDPTPGSRADVLLVCSSGGHVLQMISLRAAWEGFERVWISDDTSDTRSLLRGERVTFAHGPTSRNLRSFVLNLVLAWRIVRRTRPRVILSTGAAIAVPFAWVGRLLGAKVVYIESVTRVDSPSLSGRLVAPVANRVYVQWPELEPHLRRARYAGTVFGG
jgi:UDP-N-acetylglucosamine:LPS N-acetylglucosamine transferase